MDKPTVFISYSHKDEPWKDRLVIHLRALEQAGRITIWDDRRIDGGDKWYNEIEQAPGRRGGRVGGDVIRPQGFPKPLGSGALPKGIPSFRRGNGILRPSASE
jgi:hypothetical protein